MADAVRWWVALEVLGLLALPLAYVLFRRLPEAGYAFAKPLSVLLGGVLFWLALSTHLLSNRPGTIVVMYMVVAAISFLVVSGRGEEMIQAYRERLTFVLACEALFTVAFFAAAWLRSFVPEISGTEKPMDFMFMNAASRSVHYPPQDPWLAGYTVSYYYLGYVLQAMLSKLAGAPTAVGYNIGLASTLALAASAAFGLGYNLVALARRSVTSKAAYIGGFAAVALLLVIGNLEGVLEFAKANGIGADSFFRSVGIAGLDKAAESGTWYPNEASSHWWWWRATRISPDAGSITEFPFFSFLLGDLHPHVMAIPFALLSLAIGLAFWQSEEPLSVDYWARRPGVLLLVGALVGALGLLNTWDLFTFGFLLSVMVLARNLRAARPPDAVLDSLTFLLPLAIIAVGLYLPFYFSFSSQARGLEAVTSSATRPLHAALFWAPIFLAALPLPVVTLLRSRSKRRWAALGVAAVVPAALLALWLSMVSGDATAGGVSEAISARGWNWLTTLFFASGFVVSAAALVVSLDRDNAEEETALTPALAMTSTAMLLVLGAELFFIKDVFGTRMNSVFKLYYQAWMLLAIAGGYGLWRLYGLWSELPKRYHERLLIRLGVVSGSAAWTGAAVVALLGALLYPLGATLSRTDGLDAPGRTLDGLAAARKFQPADVAASRWLADHASGQDHILEGVGGEYSGAGRASAWTGIPTVLGWAGHELQWGRSTALVTERQSDVDRAFTTTSLEEALAILRKYGVTYVLVGSEERAKYPQAGLSKFSALPNVFSSGNAIVYRLPGVAAPPVEPPTGRSP